MLHYRHGDLSAFKELYRRHRQGLYQFIAWRSPRKDWVEEIVQDSWANLHKARATYEPQASFKTFLYQIARNRLIDILRQKQAITASDLGADDDEGSRFAHLADNADEVATPQDILDKKQQLSALRAALQTLPAEQKEALILQQFNDMRLEDIATLTGVNVETVKSRLRYAMNKLRRHILNAQEKSELA
ncbi:MAG: sigma-70 family RNA polymerase sigma factor [Proteobacteria bacterium]|nr:sigma-70 family RNA polymerase sigma factor [Pseudomonadota bacterium]